MDTIEAYGYKTKVEIYIKQWKECNIYKVDVFESD